MKEGDRVRYSQAHSLRLQDAPDRYRRYMLERRGTVVSVQEDVVMVRWDDVANRNWTFGCKLDHLVLEECER